MVSDEFKATIDTSRAPRGELAAQRLVESIVAGDDRLERHYLEVKGPLDLSTKRDQAKLAKFVLGAANRMPEKAATAFEGFAVMVIGASTGSAPGVPPIEALTIERAVRPFLGAEGPRWDLVRVPVAGGNDVLLLLVDPPAFGQGPFMCLKDGEEKLRDGAVFVRADGETREAKADELRQLMRRGESGSPLVDFEVTVIGEAIRPRADYIQPCEDYTARVRARLLNAMAGEDELPFVDLGEEDPPDAAGALAGTLKQAVLAGSAAAQLGKIPSWMRSVPEKRTQEQYIAQIDDWERSFKDACPGAAMSLIAMRLKPIEIQLANREETFFHDVNLKVHLEGGEVFGIDCQTDREELTAADLDLPLPPREWGPMPFAPSLDLPGHYANASHLLDLANMGQALARIEWKNSDSVEITFYVGDLRPQETDTCSDGNLALLVPATSDPTFISGTWEITARGHNKIYRGELTIPVADRDFTTDLWDMLSLDDDAEDEG